MGLIILEFIVFCQLVGVGLAIEVTSEFGLPLNLFGRLLDWEFQKC